MEPSQTTADTINDSDPAMHPEPSAPNRQTQMQVPEYLAGQLDRPFVVAGRTSPYELNRALVISWNWYPLVPSAPYTIR